jgi:hypothetical protein
MCKVSSNILLQFSLKISKYQAEIQHVARKNNVISDILSRHHKGIDAIFTDKNKI